MAKAVISRTVKYVVKYRLVQAVGEHFGGALTQLESLLTAFISTLFLFTPTFTAW